MHISLKNNYLLFHIFALASFLLSFYFIVFFLGFSVLPVTFFIIGLLSYLIDKKKSIYLFLFLLPITGAIPWFSQNGYSFNLMAIALFYLSGIVLSSIIKGDKYIFKELWIKYFQWFLIILWISSLFVFFKWSNLFLSFSAFLSDTQVSPNGSRISFALIFPIITLFLFSVSHYIHALIKNNKLTETKSMFFLSSGFFLSVIISVIQRFGKINFMNAPIPGFWGNKSAQYNGGFSDFNGYGFFAGVFFLYFFINIIKIFANYKKTKHTIFLNFIGVVFSVIGIILSGSRSALIFVFFGAIFLVFYKKISLKFKLLFLVFGLIVIFLFGGTVRDRLLGSFKNLASSTDFIRSVDKASNGRITMIKNSIPMITDFPVSGIGAGNFIFYLQYINFGQKYYEDLPLNQYLLILTELGVFGLLFFLLFIGFIIKANQGSKIFLILLAIIVTLLFGNAFWLPEVLLLFWVISAFYDEKVQNHNFAFKNESLFFVFILICFIISNVLSFSQLSPYRLLKQKNIVYKYGFFENRGEDFLWAKNEAGIYIKLDINGRSKNYKIFCGAPVSKLKNKKQEVIILWKGKVYKKIVFKINRTEIFKIIGKSGDEGFLQIKTNPTFNLAKMKLGKETRNLGIQFFLKNRKNNRRDK